MSIIRDTLGEDFLDNVARAVDAVGSPTFYETLLSMLGISIPWKYRYVLLYDSKDGARCAHSEGISSALMTAYLNDYYTDDPFFRLCLTHPQAGVDVIRDKFDSSVGSRRFRSFQMEARVADEVVVMLPVPQQAATVVLGWDRPVGRYTPKDVRWLKSVYGTAKALHDQHLRTSRCGIRDDGRSAFNSAVARYAPHALSRREVEIVQMALQGYDNRAIARHLGISYQVVKNRRYAIYEKLDITTERELFRLFFESVKIN